MASEAASVVERLRERLLEATTDNADMVVGLTQEELRTLLAVAESYLGVLSEGAQVGRGPTAESRGTSPVFQHGSAALSKSTFGTV